MSKPRASIFGDDESTGLDVASFAPKTGIDAKAPPAEQVRVVAKAANFPSREPKSAEPPKSAKRPSRQYRTGRNVQFNIKAKQETVDKFYALTEAQGWVLGYTLDQAVEALEQKLMKRST